MATVPGSRSGAGGKVVTNRRRQRLSTTPYDRPPLPTPPPKSPNWFTGVIIPSARAIASGAGKILSSAIFSESESSSEDEDSASDDDVDNINEYENPYGGVNALTEKEVNLSETMQHGQEVEVSVKRTETKQLIEQLVMQVTFSREEHDNLIKVLKSRVMDYSREAEERRSLGNSPGRSIDHEDVDVFNKAVLEAKKWFQQKKVGSSSVTELAHGNCNRNSTAPEHVVESRVGSPTEVARSYMKDRVPWASPTKHVEFRTPLTMKKMNLFKEEMPYSVNQEYLSSSKRRNSLSSGSWNIQEELRRVRSKATEDMLRTPPTKIDPSLFAVGRNREESTGAGKVMSGMGEIVAELDNFWKTKPIDPLMDVGVSSGPAFVALESGRDGKAREAPSSNPAVSISGNNEDSEAIQIDGEYATSKLPYPTSPSHAGEWHSDPISAKITEVAELGGRLYANGFSPSQASLSPEVAIAQNDKQWQEENHNVTENKSTNIINVEANYELLSEAYIDVPVVTETDSIASGSQNSLGVQSEESPLKMTQPSMEGKADLMTGKRGRKLGANNRRSRAKGK